MEWINLVLPLVCWYFPRNKLEIWMFDLGSWSIFDIDMLRTARYKSSVYVARARAAWYRGRKKENWFFLLAMLHNELQLLAPGRDSMAWGNKCSWLFTSHDGGVDEKDYTLQGSSCCLSCRVPENHLFSVQQGQWASLREIDHFLLVIAVSGSHKIETIDTARHDGQRMWIKHR